MLTSEVTEAIRNLGDGPPSIARKLIALGIKGTQSDPHDCPVANYLKSLFPGCRFYVNADGIEVNRHPRREAIGDHPCPDSLVDFLDRFDAGDWQELIA